MSYPINYPTPQNANIQIFKEGGTTSDWVKPQGATMVWFTLIGAGAGNSGGSGAVTNFMIPAFLIPDVLRVSVGWAGTALIDPTPTRVIYQQKDTTGYTLLEADRGYRTGGGGSAMSPNAFTSAGFFQSIAGQPRGAEGTYVNPSATTFLSGSPWTNTYVFANYGYYANNTPTSAGYFQMQPIIVGVGSGGGNRGGIGCGGLAVGGDGMAVIISW